MVKRVFCFVALTCIPQMLVAQQAPQVELFAGYSYLRAHNYFSEGLNQQGWNVSASFNFARSFGVVADVSNHYGKPQYTIGLNFSSPIGSEGKGLTFLFGPQYTFRRGSRPTPFVHALFGAIQANRYVPPVVVPLPGGIITLVPSPGCTTIPCNQRVTSFAMAFGGGLDVKAKGPLWIRAFQVEYFRANFKNFDGSSAAQNDFRISSGIVFHFGKR